MNRARPEEELTRREDLDPEPITAQLRADNPQMPEDSCLTPRAKQAEAGQEGAREDEIENRSFALPAEPGTRVLSDAHWAAATRRRRAARSRPKC